MSTVEVLLKAVGHHEEKETSDDYGWMTLGK